MPDPVTLPEWVAQFIPEDAQKDPEIAALLTPDKDGNPPDIAKYKTPVDFVKSYKNQTELIGRKGVLIPNEKSDAKEIEAFNRALGWPEKPDGYKFSELKDLHPALKLTPESQKAFAEAMHKAGVPTKYADTFNQYAAQYMSGIIAQTEKASQEAIAKANEELKKEWGDKYDMNLKSAVALVEKVGGKEAIGAFGDLGNNPKVLMFLAKLGSVISEDSISKMTTGGGSQMPEQEAAQKEISDIIADAKGARQHPLNNDKHPDHMKWAGAEGEWAKLNKKAYTPSSS
jgi:hypothetical protein